MNVKITLQVAPALATQTFSVLYINFCSLRLLEKSNLEKATRAELETVPWCRYETSHSAPPLETI